jgi:hypothetical protein
VAYEERLATLRGPSKTTARHQQCFAAQTAASVDQNPTASHRFPTLPALNPLSAVWRVYDIGVEMMSLFAAAGKNDFNFEIIRAAEIRRRAIEGDEGRRQLRRRRLRLPQAPATAPGLAARARATKGVASQLRIMTYSTHFCCVASLAWADVQYANRDWRNPPCRLHYILHYIVSRAWSIAAGRHVLRDALRRPRNGNLT